MHGKIYPSMYTGSMVGSGAMVFALMSYAIANARIDEAGSFDLNPKVLAAIFGETEEKVNNAIEFLCSPDPHSRATDEEGRRLIRVGPGPFRYRLVNIEKYRQDALLEERTEYWRDWKMWSRAGKPGNFKEWRVVHCGQVDKSGMSNFGHTSDVPVHVHVDVPNKERRSSLRKRSSPQQSIPDEEWLKSLKEDKTYAGIDIDREFGKMKNWCSVHGKIPSKRRFINWLNRSEKPMSGFAPKKPYKGL